MSPALADELAARAAEGWNPVTLSEIRRQLRDLGYALDRALDCCSTAQIMTGPRAGKTYPSLSTGIKEADTGAQRVSLRGSARRQFPSSAKAPLRSRPLRHPQRRDHGHLIPSPIAGS